jgi:hypothetical protein
VLVQPISRARTPSAAMAIVNVLMLRLLTG